MAANGDASPDVALSPGWIAPGQADALFASLHRELPWRVHRVRMFGREIDAPRLSCWIGDSNAHYRYSGTTHVPEPWPGALAAVRARLAHETGVAFNSVLANLYRDGRDCMGWHSDDEPEFGPRPVIASVSLGATRRFVLRHRREPTRKVAFELAHGSLLLMRGETQRDWRHALPRTARALGPRINLTFRRVIGRR
ncbi:alpha-ketoglutarate-dependent dioxygenase AlkB family protein [Luteimonas kalidii]|uniref:Alpha-ketoglutarate-dependent dioxygenase AlkB n=1 Tax=Luteimonas kalidii TaxID=3042025 RepID=A0ABT6JVJ7_9GAMM|nr:alpha-ketoglutarate-dependent dioxygenase AlkB [Luteimonas kalidii]MDH5834700.1 alpha-ketoglutarate-dependent dioxygenase AlkB [Luteimonas kalidii]